MTAAIFGLLGVLVGGLITWAVELWQARYQRREKGRVAVRLLLDEFGTCLSRAEASLDQGIWWLPENDLPLDVWHIHRADLAAVLPIDDWLKLGVAALAIEQMDQAARREDPETRELTAEGRELLAGHVAAVGGSLEVLNEAVLRSEGGGRAKVLLRRLRGMVNGP